MKKNKTILVTGGCGYIGSHTVIELIKNNYDVVVLDNLSNSKIEVLNRVRKITNLDKDSPRIKFYLGDILDKNVLDRIFTENDIYGCIHFAGLKAVGESTQIPLKYYENNISGTVVLLNAMKEHNVKNIIFSSSATVYGDQKKQPIKETAKLNEPTNPYGKTKLFIEYILKDLYKSDNSWNIVILRYFNPIGAHESGLIGEDPNGIPNNLMPYITQVAIGKRDHLNVFGNDYPTHDGTGVRDYIHVVDLAKGHVCALSRIKKNKGLDIYNLGTGTGYSVLDIVKAFEEANNLKIKYEITPRRPGDIATCYSCPDKAYKQMKFKCEKTLLDMCRDSWNYQKNNPNGIQ